MKYILIIFTLLFANCIPDGFEPIKYVEKTYWVTCVVNGSEILFYGPASYYIISDGSLKIWKDLSDSLMIFRFSNYDRVFCTSNEVELNE